MSGGEMAATSAFEADAERRVGSSPTRTAKLFYRITVNISAFDPEDLGSIPSRTTNTNN